MPISMHLLCFQVIIQGINVISDLDKIRAAKWTNKSPYINQTDLISQIIIEYEAKQSKLNTLKQNLLSIFAI